MIGMDLRIGAEVSVTGVASVRTAGIGVAIQTRFLAETTGKIGAMASLAVLKREEIRLQIYGMIILVRLSKWMVVTHFKFHGTVDMQFLINYDINCIHNFIMTVKARIKLRMRFGRRHIMTGAACFRSAGIGVAG